MPVQVLFGNVWPVLNPWLAVADAVAWLWRALGQEWTPPLAYPERLGVWPGAVLLFCFAALELAYAEPASPRALALAIALYSYAMWFGMAAFGRRQWDDHGNGFTVYFGLLARIAPFGEHDGRLVVRMPFSGLAGPERTPGMLAFIAVMLGSVGFDGLSRSPFWQNLRADVEGRTSSTRPARPSCSRPPLPRRPRRLRPARRARLPRRDDGSPSDDRADRPLAPEFLLSLVPIALVYAVAHYFTLLVIQGQYAWSARVRPVRLRLGPVRHGRLRAEHRAVLARTPSGTSRSARSSRATSPGSRSRTTGRSRSSPSATRSAPSTPCWA